jgi:hypothetical protein
VRLRQEVQEVLRARGARAVTSRTKRASRQGPSYAGGGWVTVDTHFGDAMRALRAVPGFRRETVRGTDHTFTSLWAQRHVADLLTDHLARRHLGRSA